MRVAIIFRGDNVRSGNGPRKYVDAMMCWDNWQKTLVNDLTNNGHSCHVIFITYESLIINRIREEIKPNSFLIEERKDEYTNYWNVVKFMREN